MNIFSGNTFFYNSSKIPAFYDKLSFLTRRKKTFHIKILGIFLSITFIVFEILPVTLIKLLNIVQIVQKLLQKTFRPPFFSPGSHVSRALTSLNCTCSPALQRLSIWRSLNIEETARSFGRFVGIETEITLGGMDCLSFYFLSHLEIGLLRMKNRQKKNPDCQWWVAFYVLLDGLPLYIYFLSFKSLFTTASPQLR